MQDGKVIVSAMGEHIPQRVISEPVSVSGVTIRKTVNSTPDRHVLKIHVPMQPRRSNSGHPSRREDAQPVRAWMRARQPLRFHPQRRSSAFRIPRARGDATPNDKLRTPLRFQPP